MKIGVYFFFLRENKIYIFGSCRSDTEIISRIYKELWDLTNKKITQQETDKGFEYILLQKRHVAGKQAHENILSIVSH